MYFPTVFIVFIVLFITFKKNEFGGEFRGLITTIVFAKNLRKGSKNRTWMIWIRWISMIILIFVHPCEPWSITIALVNYRCTSSIV